MHVRMSRNDSRGQDTSTPRAMAMGLDKLLNSHPHPSKRAARLRSPHMWTDRERASGPEVRPMKSGIGSASCSCRQICISGERNPG